MASSINNFHPYLTQITIAIIVEGTLSFSYKLFLEIDDIIKSVNIN